MSETVSISMRYQPRIGGEQESRWIRIEQERPEDETVTLDEAAEIIDSLYDIEPCNDGMGGGGEEATEEPPDQKKFEKTAARVLERRGLCRLAEYWVATINVYRSHRQPGYVLRSETAEVESTTPVRGSYRQYVEVSGAVIELDRPYDGGLSGIPAGIKWTVRGSTVNLDRSLSATLVLRYNTYHERVTLRVPTTQQAASALQFVGGGTGMTGTSRRTELPSAAVVAFWGDLASSCELEPPEQDDDVSEDELDQLCRKGMDEGGGISDSSPGGCWKTVHHYSRCSCSYKRTREYDTEEPAPCNGAPSGAHVGTDEKFGGFVWCEGEEDEINDPEYYKKHCCHPPPRPLPRCRKSYATYNGGRKIESGPDHYRNIYGDDVIMRAVLPRDGKCGEMITTWDVPSRDCCDDVEEMAPDEHNPTTIHAPGGALLCVTGGRSPRRWEASAGYTFANGQNVIELGERCATVYAGEDACNTATINVEDDCSRVSMTLERDNPEQEMALLPEEAVAAPESYVTVIASHAQGEVQWSAGQLRLISPQGEHSATFRAPEEFCGTDTITAVDACGKTASALVLSTRGRWEEVPGGPWCSAPWSGKAPATAQSGGNICSGPLSGKGYVVSNYQGYRAHVCVATTRNYMPPSDGGCPHGGSCGEAFDDYQQSRAQRFPCDYSGVEMIVDGEGEQIMPCNEQNPYYEEVRCPPLCANYFRCHKSYDPVSGQYVPSREANIWHAASMAISKLWKWVC